MTDYTGFVLVLMTVFFAIQIYCDFSGYSDIARGTAKLLGIELSENFKSPYFSSSIKEFWSRWHISLSTWFKDYVYIPLGGNRCSKLRRSLNLMITFLVSGIWHGASWTYVIWGAVHGMYQIIESSLHLNKKELRGSFKWWVRVFGTVVFVLATWVFFRAQSLADAIYVFSHLFDGIHLSSVGAVNLAKYLVFIMILLIYDFFNLKMDVISVIGSQKTWVRYLIYYVLIMVIVFFHAVGEVSFVYFQF